MMKEHLGNKLYTLRSCILAILHPCNLTFLQTLYPCSPAPLRSYAADISGDASFLEAEKTCFFASLWL